VKDPRIVPDMGVRVSFLEAARPEAPKQKPGVLVPAAAIVARGNDQVAFVVADEQVHRRAVSVGRSLGEDREVTQGLSAGETVVLDPPEKLADGDRVRVAAEGASADEGE
jgi:hypothetical protein